MLKAKNIHKSYGELEVLKGIDLSVGANEIISIVGASGAGKSTLLQILGTLDTPDQGSLEINGKSIFKLSSKELASFRNEEIGFVFQFHNLLPEFTLFENICMPAYIQGRKDRALKEYAFQLMDMLKISARSDHKPSQLSGGDLQRASVARSLINKPSLIFADEPSGNLDTKNAEELHALFFQLQRDLGQSFVIVTHNIELADMADRKITIQDGLILN